jgi:hypothetical protein
MAISKVGTSKVNTPKAPPAPEKAKTSAPAAQTAAAGWAAGANKASSLKITHASIGDGPKLSEKVSVPKGFAAEVKNLSMKDSDTVHGTKVSIEQDGSQLNISGPGGKKFSIGSNEASLKEMQKEWRTEVDAAKKAPKEEWMQLEWSSSNGISGAGTAGKLFSISEGGSYYSGGAHPSNGSAISTYDARTGQQVKLDQLLSPKQMNELVNDISARLNKMNGPDEIGPEAFGAGGDKAQLRDTINSNFALSTDKNGKVKIDIAWESGVHALSGLMAHFSVDAPTDQAFKTAIGAE